MSGPLFFISGTITFLRCTEIAGRHRYKKTLCDGGHDNEKRMSIDLKGSRYREEKDKRTKIKSKTCRGNIQYHLLT